MYRVDDDECVRECVFLGEQRGGKGEGRRYMVDVLTVYNNAARVEVINNRGLRLPLTSPLRPLRKCRDQCKTIRLYVSCTRLEVNF